MDDRLRLRARAARVEITRGALRGPSLFELLDAVPSADRDAFVDEMLAIEPPPPDRADLPRGAVPYLPCGVAEIMTAVREAPVRAGDDFVNIGSGLGRVVVLAHLLSGVRSSGIEIQEHLADRARRCAEALALQAVTFVHANAEDLELTGSVFFLYAPCNGPMLARVLERLAAAARRRPIVVAAVDLEFHDVAWLVRRETSSRALVLYDSH